VTARTWSAASKSRGLDFYHRHESNGKDTFDQRSSMDLQLVCTGILPSLLFLMLQDVQDKILPQHYCNSRPDPRFLHNFQPWPDFDPSP
jgi:hypothetical protein